MPASFWIKRFLLVFGCTFAALCLVQLVKGRPLADALGFALLWASIATAVFTLSRYLQARRGRNCALCNDMPERRRAAGDA